MIERIFRGSRLLVLVAVVVCAISSVLLYGASVNIILNVALDVVRDIPASADGGKSLAVRLLKLLDLLLIAITFQIIAVSLYRLFIRQVSVEESKFLSALDIRSFHDLKITLSQVAVVILVILFLEQAVQVGATLETLYLGAAIGIVIAASVYAWKHMKH
ncbi:YqhA family protein [Isoalcanivorax indicus]|uniref:YqhA family protein n=1 Tax=Isoalcanivorax indicus TaxID=2202653 RepID=UPI000DB92CD6|nr:YqhA family protein [Isoalcanivorax indicus]